MSHHTHTDHSCHSEPRRASWFSRKLAWGAFFLCLLALMGSVVPPLAPFQQAFVAYLRMIAFPVALGLLIGGAIDYFIPKEYVSRILARPGRGTILNAVFLGFLMSACSHGILAISMALYRKGASAPAVVSFLLASPWANLPLTILLFGFFGVTGGLAIVLGAILIALVTGSIFLWLDEKGLIERNPQTASFESGFSIREDFLRRLRSRSGERPSLVKGIGGILKGSAGLADMVLWWIVIGMGIAAFVSAYVPPGIFERYLGPTFLGLLATLGIAVVMEVCSEGTAPLSFEIYRQTGALGNSFLFLMGGVVTDYTEIGLVWHNIGRRAALWLMLITIPQAVFLGWVLNLLSS